MFGLVVYDLFNDDKFLVVVFLSLLVFRRKDLCEAKHEMQSVFKFGRPGGRSTGRSTPHRAAI